MEKKLGKLEKVELRDFWVDEGRDFTPWLVKEENIILLGEALGIDMEVIQQEQPVGSFRADIYARNISNDTHILIENQLEKTDHGHLGQIITYAAGLDATMMIWISPQFSEQHRAALDWLNRTTNENISFFAIEIELWRIGDSLSAPKFNIVCKPNDWARSIQQTMNKSELTPTQSLQLEYWTTFNHLVISSGSPIKCRTPHPRSWMDFSIGKNHVYMTAYMNTREDWIAVAMWVGGPKRDSIFCFLKEKYESLSHEKISQDVVWKQTPDRQWDEIKITKSADPTDRASWNQQHIWLKDTLEKYYKFFYEKIKNLDISEYE